MNPPAIPTWTSMPGNLVDPVGMDWYFLYRDGTINLGYKADGTDNPETQQLGSGINA